MHREPLGDAELNVNSVLIKHDCEETVQRGPCYNFKDSVMRLLSWWPPSSRSWDSNEGRTVRGRKEGGELSLSQTGRTRLPAFSLHLPNCQGPQASPSQGSRVATTTTMQPHRLVPMRTCKSTLFSGKRICFRCPEAWGSGLYSSLPISLLVSLLPQADKQTQTQKPKQIFFLLKKKVIKGTIRLGVQVWATVKGTLPNLYTAGKLLGGPGFKAKTSLSPPATYFWGA